MFEIKADFFFCSFLHSEERHERWDWWQDAPVQEEGQGAPDLGLKDGTESLYVLYFFLFLSFNIIATAASYLTSWNESWKSLTRGHIF